jgi:carbonic anhydrase
MFAAGALAAAATLPARAQTLTRAARDAMTPDQVIAEMQSGNVRFRAGQQRPRDWMAQQRAAAAGQYPKAVPLSCIDSRAAEIVTEMGLGDIFNSRIAGNVHDVAVLGGMAFACKVAGAKLVMVLGHTACGAVAGAIAGAELGSLTALPAKSFSITAAS